MLTHQIIGEAIGRIKYGIGNMAYEIPVYFLITLKV
jgi:hypothetical protein